MSILTDKQQQQLRAKDPELTFLTVRYHSIEGVRQLVKFVNEADSPHLTGLSFDECELGDELLDALSGLKPGAISSLHVSGPDSLVTDTGLSKLSPLFGSLEHLEISGTLSKTCLLQLLDSGSTKLKSLEITSSLLRDDDVRPLLKSNPSLEIFLNGSDTPVPAKATTFGEGYRGALFAGNSYGVQHEVSPTPLLEILEKLQDARYNGNLEALSRKLDASISDQFLNQIRQAMTVVPQNGGGGW